MKRTLLMVALLVSAGVHAQTVPPMPRQSSADNLAAAGVALENRLSDTAVVGAISNSGSMPEGYPDVIYVQRIPDGSGTPNTGVASSSYEAAEPVGDGLYHVPGYLPWGPTDAVPQRVVQVACHGYTLYGEGSFGVPRPHADDGAHYSYGKTIWRCNGYSIDPNRTRGENILLQPVFIKEVKPVAPSAPPVLPYVGKAPHG